MKIVKDNEGTPTTKTVAIQKLNTDDSMKAGVSHEIIIDKQTAWVKFEATTTQGVDETSDDAKRRIIKFVSESVIDAVESAVNTANEVNEKGV